MKRHKQILHLTLCVLAAMSVVSMRIGPLCAAALRHQVTSCQQTGLSVPAFPVSASAVGMRAVSEPRFCAIQSQVELGQTWPVATPTAACLTAVTEIGAAPGGFESSRCHADTATLTLHAQKVCLRI
jgi:hypothetical protein